MCGKRPIALPGTEPHVVWLIGAKGGVLPAKKSIATVKRVLPT